MWFYPQMALNALILAIMVVDFIHDEKQDQVDKAIFTSLAANSEHKYKILDAIEMITARLADEQGKED